MAPTELLAEQHFETLASWFEPLGFHGRLVIGQREGESRDTVLAQLKANQIHFLVAPTHCFKAKLNSRS